jgi:uncharacterized protein (DUF1015 family)
MAIVLPFAGMRPPSDLVEQVAAPPYDVLSSTEARELAENNPHSFLHINKPEIDLPINVDVYSDAVYAQGGENISDFINNGILVQDSIPAFYIYRQSLGDHQQTGIVCLVSVDEYENNHIKKHELTRPQKENDRVQHMQAVNAQVGPVLMIYAAEKKLSDIVGLCSQNAPDYNFDSDSVRHQLWLVDDSELQHEISEAFTSVQELYIADGHHRSAAAARYREICRAENPDHTGDEAYNFFMSVLFPHDELNILGYHRVVRDLNGMDPKSFLDALSKTFEITPKTDQVMPTAPNQFGLYLDSQWFQLTLQDFDTLGVEEDQLLDVAILQNTVLSPLLDIIDIRSDNRIDFVGGLRGQTGIEKAVNSGEFTAGFACFPVKIEQLMAIASQNKLMPPKSTWFEPKLKSGLVVHSLG